jgi:hypothetical protein
MIYDYERMQHLYVSVYMQIRNMEYIVYSSTSRKWRIRIIQETLQWSIGINEYVYMYKYENEMYVQVRVMNMYMYKYEKEMYVQVRVGKGEYV